MKILSVVGARPNFMKIAPFVRAINNGSRTQKLPITHTLVHTGQHYDFAMSDAFFQELGIPSPDLNLGVGSGSHGYQIGQTMIEFEKAMLTVRPDWVVVVGDVNATAAAAIVARKHGTRVAHIEAGLRSFDWTMPEEINRVVTDRLSNLLFTTDLLADENLKREGTSPDAICRVGNIMMDTLEYERPRAVELDPLQILLTNQILPERSVDACRYTELADYALVTIHRPSNVDAPEMLTGIIEALAQISNVLPVIFPIHPRTQKKLQEFGLWEKTSSSAQLHFTRPLGYRELLRLNMGARAVLTDSGGVQEEACVLGTPCLTLRENTERPITLIEHGGTNRLVGNDPKTILECFQQAASEPRHPFRPEFWDGHTAERVLHRLLEA